MGSSLLHVPGSQLQEGTLLLESSAIFFFIAPISSEPIISMMLIRRLNVAISFSVTFFNMARLPGDPTTPDVFGFGFTDDA